MQKLTHITMSMQNLRLILRCQNQRLISSEEERSLHTLCTFTEW